MYSRQEHTPVSMQGKAWAEIKSSPRENGLQFTPPKLLLFLFL